jgi:HEAT repeat protein
MDEILKNLESGDPVLQDAATRALEQIGDNRAVVILALCLDRGSWRQSKGFDPEWRGPHGERPQGRVVYEPLSYVAAKALARIVPDPSPGHDQQPITDDLIDRWKEWWATHRNRYESK